MDYLPAVVTLGVHEFQRSLSRAWAELASGAVVRVMAKRQDEERGWLWPERPPGCESPEPVTCSRLREHVGQVFELVALGTVFEVRDGRAGEIRGYLAKDPPEGIARLRAALQYTARLPRTAYGGGGLRLREVIPDEAVAAT